MERTEQLFRFIDGACLIEYGGSLYEYKGHTEQGVILSDVNTGDRITWTIEKLLNDPGYTFHERRQSNG